MKTGVGLSATRSAGSKRFPRLALQMIQVGEESGELDTMLLKVADTFDSETAQRARPLLAALVPAMTVVMAAIVGVVILSVLMPIYDLTNAIG